VGHVTQPSDQELADRLTAVARQRAILRRLERYAKCLRNLSPRSAVQVFSTTLSVTPAEIDLCLPSAVGRSVIEPSPCPRRFAMASLSTNSYIASLQFGHLLAPS
jgi:hypothetical protein